MNLSRRILSLKPSATLELASQARALKEEGKDVISLSVGEPDWPTFGVAADGGHAAIDEGQTRYTPVGGFNNLREAVAQLYLKELGISYGIKNVLISPGGKFSLYALFSSLINPGDEAIIPAPYWVSYPPMIELVGGKPVIVSGVKENNFKLRATDLEKAITEKTKIVILNSPSNPTGEVYSASELADLAQVIKKHEKLTLISDDIYSYLTFSGSMAPHILQANKSLKNQVALVSGVSKSYAMTGWRIGWSVGPESLIAAASKFQGQTSSCASSISQMAALGALQKGSVELSEAVKKLKQRRDFAYTEINKLPHIQANKPDGAFYFWVEISHYLGKNYKGRKIETSTDFSLELLNSEWVACVPGIAFGQEGYVRMSYAIENQKMAEALERINRFLKNIK